jgi:transposase
VFTERTSVGLDVHARSVAAAAIDGVTGELVQARLVPSYDQVLGWIQNLPGPAAAAYEAGPTGFGLSRHLNAAGVRCVVAAPSKLQRPAGHRVKTDARDAIHLARLLRLDEVTPVVVPSIEQEAARDLVRAREDCRADLMRARHRLSKLLLRHGIVYSGGKAWTGIHDEWLVIAQMVAELGPQTTLEGRLDQPRDQPAGTGQLDLAGVDPREQRIQRAGRRQLLDHVRTTNGAAALVGHEVHHRPLRRTRPLHKQSDTPFDGSGSHSPRFRPPSSPTTKRC